MMSNDRIEWQDSDGDPDLIAGVRGQQLTTKNTHPADVARIQLLLSYAENSPLAMRALSSLAVAVTNLHSARDLADHVGAVLDAADSEHE